MSVFVSQVVTERQARTYVEMLVWGDQPTCPNCAAKNRAAAVKSWEEFYQCGDCRSIYSVRTRTIFENSKVGFRRWICAAYLHQTARKVIGSHPLSRAIGVTQKTSRLMLHRLRKTRVKTGARALPKRGYNGIYHNGNTQPTPRAVNEFTLRLIRKNRRIDTIKLSPIEKNLQKIFRSQSRPEKPDTFNLFIAVSQTKSDGEIAAILGLHGNTVTRWRAQKLVPQNYHYDFLRMLGKSPQAAVKQDTERNKDQFYTKPEVARHCFERFCAVAKSLGVDLSHYHFIEPAAGCGGFYAHFPSARRLGIDIEPGGDKRLICGDYLQWIPPTDSKRYVVVGNPPFGLRGHLALQFINHSAAFADMVAFILPQLFDSDGKGVPGKRVKEYRLAHTERLATNSFQYPDGRPVSVSTVFQVWTKINTAQIKIKARPTAAKHVRIFSLSDGGTPASTRNKHMIGRCDVYLPSTCFDGMRAYENFEELPYRRGYGVEVLVQKPAVKKVLAANDWTKTAFLSTNSAMNLRRSLIESVVANAGYGDE